MKNMKKFTHVLALIAMAALPFAMTSCDDHWDDGPHNNWHGGDNPGGYNPGGGETGGETGSTVYDMANTLIGEWNGPVNLYEEQADGSLQLYSFNTTMIFYTNGGSNTLKGSGMEYDYTDDASQELEFTWRIDSSTWDIYITYKNSGATFVLDYGAAQHGFYLDNTSFNGYMLSTTGNDYMVFQFTRTTSNAKAQTSTASSTTSTTAFGTVQSFDDFVTNVQQKLPTRR